MPEVAGRWRITGRLRCESLLHVGTGEATTREALVNEEGELVQVAAVALDGSRRPYLPSTSLKGVLRAWASRHLGDDHRTLIEEVFGAESLRKEQRGDAGGTIEEDRSDGRGGDVVFFDSLQPAAEGDGERAGDEVGENAGEVSGNESRALPPYWSEQRHTGVVARVAIDRFYGSASPRRLFHLEVVPHGTEFEVDIVGESGSGTWLDPMALVLAALESFDGAERTRIGARTGDGWGTMSWHLESLRRLRRRDLQRWLESESPEPVMQAASLLSPEDEQLVTDRMQRFRSQISDSPRVASRWTLRFDGAFLVRDVDKAHRGDAEHPPDAVARRDERHRPLLPASSFRGVLRAQAERIVRTLGGEGAACGVDAPRAPCDAVETTEEVKALCPVCKIFGAAGWRAPLAVGRFLGEADAAPFPQHFLAIDRLTGGGARERKFEVQGVMQPSLEGDLLLDLETLEVAGAGAWALGLLVLVLRDLAEGDLAFGSGAAKGYGRCRGVLDQLDVPEPGVWPEKFLASLGVAAEELGPPESWLAPPLSPDSSRGRALSRWLEDLGRVARTSHESWSRDGERPILNSGGAS